VREEHAGRKTVAPGDKADARNIYVRRLEIRREDFYFGDNHGWRKKSHGEENIRGRERARLRDFPLFF
jgi:hypothetical protein